MTQDSPPEQPLNPRISLNNLDPFLNVIREAIKAVPAVKYGLGVLGIVAVISLAGMFVTSYRVAVLGTIVALGLMTALVIFAHVVKLLPKFLVPAAVIFLYTFLVLTVATAGFIFTSVFFQWPVNLKYWIASNKVPAEINSTKEDKKPSETVVAGQDSDIRLVDCTISNPDPESDSLPIIDIKLRNIGAKTAFLKRAGLELLGSATFEDCSKPQHTLVRSSWTYDLDIDENPEINISQALEPNQVDRFQIKVGRKQGGPTLTVYKAKLFIKYNEDNRTLNSEPFFVKMVGPTVALAALYIGVTKEEWNACVERNNQKFGAIGYKIYKDKLPLR